MSNIVYVDNAATTKIKPEVLDKMMPYLTEFYGNPSSIYSIANESKKAIDKAREKVAKAIHADPKEIVFTSGATESDNWALKGIAYANRNKGNHIITTKIEHHAVLHAAQQLEKEGFEVTYLDVDEFGVVDLEELKRSIKKETILISVMFANNEIGTIEPIKEIGQIAKEKHIFFHTDAVQAIGNVPIDVNELGLDLLSLTGHKIYGPKGIGALYIRKGTKILPFMNGGAQESKRRGGTENIAYIVGLGQAIEMATSNIDEKVKKISILRDKFIRRVQEEIPYVRLNGHPSNRLCNNANFSFRYIEGEGLLLFLDMKGICASSGSACTSGSLDPSHVLLAIGLPHEIAHGSLRVTFGDFNTEQEVDYVVDELKVIVDRLRKMSPLYEEVEKE
ncbi:cysteine desulfurase NifS [Acetivibrio sp. MSJd-27]|jgi:cysteine desulfurase nifS|uniref:cysteine desulfurase NifS n=1 Tax=Acetivibrio sp. MSJd-27 TaxID=2841523 RepID=UPI001C113F72|nr:cysteine desulfurase NifS [Acetivibrio sp. MSJd-27]MBU5451367.1 cysteine desulfurase NifS [Acetivibrio sp. MSJd-27]